MHAQLSGFEAFSSLIDANAKGKRGRPRSPRPFLKCEKSYSDTVTEIKFETNGAVKIFKLTANDLAHLDMSWLNREYVLWCNNHNKTVFNNKTDLVLASGNEKEEILVQFLLTKPSAKLDFLPEKITLKKWESKRFQEKGSMSNNSVRYDELQLVGRGGFSEVFVGRKVSTGQYVAIKRIDKSTLEADGLKKQSILDERTNMLNLRGPFVANLIRAFQTKKHFYFVMDYIPCGTLSQLIRRSRLLTEEEIKHIICEIIAAMEFAHKAGYILRDLKSDNVLLDENGHLYLCDMGLVTKGPNDGKKLMTSCGTAEYMAPEVMFRKGYTYSADYYSLGVIAYELAERRPPFCRSTKEESIPSQVKKGVPALKNNRSSEFEEFVFALLQTNPKRRLGSAAGISEITSHCWLKDVKFQSFRDRKNNSPTSLYPLLKLSSQISRILLSKHNQRDPQAGETGEATNYLAGFSLNTIASDNAIEDLDEAVSGDKNLTVEPKWLKPTYISTLGTIHENLTSLKNSTHVSIDDESAKEGEVETSPRDLEPVVNLCFRTVPKENKQVMQG